jgi:hypothetical protein
VELSLASSGYQSAWHQILSVFRNTIKETVETVKLKDLSITLRGGLSADNWRSKGDQVLQVLAEQELPVAISFDEIAILVNRLLRGSDYVVTSQRRDDVDAFLSWLRARSIRHKGRINRLSMQLRGSKASWPAKRKITLQFARTVTGPQSSNCRQSTGESTRPTGELKTAREIAATLTGNGK